MKEFKIGEYEISQKRMFIIAEAGVNHDGDFNQAVALVKAAKKAGADAVKFQAFTAEGLCDLVLTEEKDVDNLTGGTKSSFDMYKTLEFSDDELGKLKRIADDEGIMFFASVFDMARAQLLHEMGVELFKISSGDITHFPLLKYVASFGQPIILSTGMATMVEVKNAVATLEESGCQELALLHCTSDYPPRESEINLNAILSMIDATNYPVGYSDHTIGTAVPYALAGMKAPMLEKHFTIDSNLPGPDHKLSLDAASFREMVSTIRNIEVAMGSYDKHPTEREREIVKTTRRGLKAARTIKKGELLGAEDIRIIKPMTGLTPDYSELIVGKKVMKTIKVNSPINKDDIEW